MGFTKRVGRRRVVAGLVLTPLLLPAFGAEVASAEAAPEPAAGAPAFTTTLPPIFVRTWGSTGSGPGQFKSPFGIALDSTQNVYVADVLNSRVQKFTSLGVFVTQ